MGRYVLTKKIKKILISQNYELCCKICLCPLQVGDILETKQQRRGRSKFYHAKCYDDSFYDAPDLTPEEEAEIDRDMEEAKAKYFKRPVRIMTEEEDKSFSTPTQNGA